jgi:mannose-1-phosphate guanylyltransferase
MIMAGGTSNSFWPISRESRPKQFLEPGRSGKTFVKAAYDRCKGVVPDENIMIITLDRFSSFVKDEIPELPEKNLILEPYGKKTGPCVVYATYYLLKRNPKATVAMIPSDLMIRDEDAYRKALSSALDYAAANKILMTLGVKPDRPDPNYGYIQACGGAKAFKSGKPVKVKTFTEKPSKELAEVFFKSGEFYWNSGIFVWQAEVIREEMEKHAPEITHLFSGWEGAFGTKAEQTFVYRAYTDCPKISIDYAVMEKTDKDWLYPVNFGWSDIDSWNDFYGIVPAKDGSGNAIHCDKTLLEDTSDCMIYSHGDILSGKGKLVAIKGLENYLVIDTPDVLLICPKDDKTYRDFVSGTAFHDFDKYR